MIAGLPYDAEVEYLESTGTQYIDTGVAANSSFTNTIVASFTEYYSNGNYSLVGAGNPSQQPSNRICTQYGEWTAWFRGAWVRSNIEIVVDKKHMCSWGHSGFYIDGILKSTATPSNMSNATYLFCYNNIDWMIPSGFVKAKIYSFNIKDNNDKTLLDFIPVRVGSGENAVGYMYDRVTRKLFGNSGSGKFIIGQDISKPILGLHMFEEKN